MNDQNNFLVAIVLSLAVLLGWQFFVTEPRLEEERVRQQAEAALQDNGSGSAVSPVQDAPQNDLANDLAAEIAPQAENGAPQVASAGVPAGFAAAPRLSVETPQLTGSIALMGARFDDLVLKAYGANADEDAPRQVLLQSEGKKGHWQAHHGFVAAPNSPVTLADEQTIWELVAGSTLTPNTPVTLRHVTREGIVMTQEISVDENFMFTITQRAQNKSDAAVTLYPFGQITRTGTPQLTDLFLSLIHI